MLQSKNQTQVNCNNLRELLPKRVSFAFLISFLTAFVPLLFGMFVYKDFTHRQSSKLSFSISSVWLSF